MHTLGGLFETPARHRLNLSERRKDARGVGGQASALRLDGQGTAFANQEAFQRPGRATRFPPANVAACLDGRYILKAAVGARVGSSDCNGSGAEVRGTHGAIHGARTAISESGQLRPLHSRLRINPLGHKGQMAWGKTTKDVLQDACPPSCETEPPNEVPVGG